MNQTSHTGQISLSSGTITLTDWSTEQVLTVAHEGWDEGTAVTVTVGTGLSDAAGNELAGPVSVTFYTMSSELVFLSSIPQHGAVDVNRSSRIELLFSAPMNAVSLASHLTLRDGDLNDLPFTVARSDGDWMRVTPDEDLPADATISLAVDAGAQDQDGRPLADPVSISFATGDEVDTTPPAILSIAPPSGGTIPDGTSVMIVTFSEPMDPDSVVPSEMGAEFWWLISSQQVQPVWSQDYTELTIGLPAPLPAGLPLWITFAGYADANGNVQQEETHWSVVVAGAADYYPVIDGRELEYFVTWFEGVIGDDDPTDQGAGMGYEKFEFQTGGTFHLVEYEDGGYQQPLHTQIMRRTSTALQVFGWIEHEDEGDQAVTFDDPLTLLRLPPVQGQTWSSSTGSPQAPPSGQIAADGQWVETVDRLEMSYDKDGPVFFWTNVWVATIEYRMSAGDATMQSGQERMYLAPGIGVVKTVQQHLDHQRGRWDWSDKRLVIPGMR